MPRGALLVPCIVALLGCGRLAYAPGSSDAPGGDARDRDAAGEGGGLDGASDVRDDGRAEDTGRDAGPPPPPTRAIAPANGHATGSPHAAGVAPATADPLRPLFRWEPVDGADRYRVEVDDSCDASARRSCAFPSPELVEETALTTFRPAADLPVALTVPVGRRYYWRVRACTATGACSAATEPRYLDVGRVRTDVNGDGYADLVVGAPSQAGLVGFEGKAFAFHGGPTGFSAAAATTLESPDHELSSWYGVAVAALGDVNGDGFGDVAVGAHLYDGAVLDRGAAWAYHGGPGGLATTPATTLGRSAPVDHAGFGSSLGGAGDVNGDGYADAVVGAYGETSRGVRGGAAFVYYGGPAGLFAAPAVTLDRPLAQVGADFGHSVAGAGDVNGDGYGDVVVGAPYADALAGNEGDAHLFLGSPEGLSSEPAVAFGNPAHADSGYFGDTVTAAGDVDGDGYGDLAIGARGQATELGVVGGSVFVYRGGREGPAADPSVSLHNPADGPLDQFGAGLAGAGDLNGDGFGDLVVGAYQQSAPEDREGRAFVYYGAFTGLEPLPHVMLDNPADQPTGYFGVAVAGAGDSNGDGYDELAAGAYWQANPETQEGAVFVYAGGPAGIAEAPDVSLDNPEDATGGNFGLSLARAVP